MLGCIDLVAVITWLYLGRAWNRLGKEWKEITGAQHEASARCAPFSWVALVVARQTCSRQGRDLH